MEISQERLEAFWKRWGFTQYKGYHNSDGSIEAGWVVAPGDIDAPYYDYTTSSKLPNITLDNLFKHAVPAAEIYNVDMRLSDGKASCYISDEHAIKYRIAEADTPALALFLALEKLP